MNYTVVIPNHYRDVIEPLLRSIHKYENSPDVLIVADRHDLDYGYRRVRIDGKFIFSHAVNVGIDSCAPNDVILLNDDVRLIMPTFRQLSKLAYSDDQIGILSPLIDGGCGNLFMRASRTDLWKPGMDFHFCNAKGGDRVTFACVYIKRSLIDSIGRFDENFKGYGFDDADMSIRTVKSGWKLAITNKLTVMHGKGGNVFKRGYNWNTSFFRAGAKGARENLAYLRSIHPSMVRK